jgi:hypothetical protein
MTVLPAPAGGTPLRPGILRHRLLRRTLAILWVAGAAVIWIDAVNGPFSALLIPGAALCLISGLTLRWCYRRLLVWAPDDLAALDEREASQRGRTYRIAYRILGLLLLLVLFPTMFVLSGYPDGGWRLKELAYLIPLALIWAPGAAAAFVLPADTDDPADQPTY